MKHLKNEFNILVPTFSIPGCQYEITQLLVSTSSDSNDSRALKISKMLMCGHLLLSVSVDYTT